MMDSSMMSEAVPPLSKSRSLPDLSCPHGHHLHLHLHDQDSQQAQESTQDSTSSVKSHQSHHLNQQLLQQQQPNFFRDNHHKLSLLSGSQFRPFFHSSSSSLSSDSCLSHSLPPHNALLAKDSCTSSKAPSEEDYESLKLISNGAYG